MKKPTTIILGLLLLSLPGWVSALDNWPREIAITGGKVIMYQPQTDSMKGDHLFSRIAISITTDKIKNPVFGAIWTDSRFSTDRESGTCTIFNVKLLNIRFPGIDTINPARVSEFKNLLEKEASGWNIEFSLEELKGTIENSRAATTTSASFKNDPPEIIYRKQLSLLVLFDGDPVFKETGTGGPKRAINTPFLILQDTKEKGFYLFGGQYWYKSADPVKSPWSNVAKPSEQVLQYFEALKMEMEKAGKIPPPASDKAATAPVIVVRTTPAELIQSKGEASYAPIQGTQLLYMTNTEDHIFMTIDKNLFYVLLSGRWYSSPALSGPWKFIEADKLPADFAKIPEGSPKDIVLASVAGTEAAKEAVMDAQIPQTAAVDRKTAKCEVKWDGEPKFGKISGTALERGLNTSSTVLLLNGTYFVCDNAVWFTGTSPTGPWVVATTVPDEVQKIPPEDPAYNVKYVYIYEVQPEVVYVGYTPGYTGCYIYGPTVVYGTGYPYVPFYGPYYYPRPVTFGFSMHYNPWYGWSMGFSMSYGMFTFSFGGPMGYPGGCWGPPMYHPPYHAHYSHYYGARPPAYRRGNTTINIDNSRNIYNNRNDGSARPSQQPSVSTRPAGNRTGQPGVSTQPAGGNRNPGASAGTRESRPADRSAGQNNVFTDRNGDVYRKNNGDWQRNNGSSWESAQPSTRDAGNRSQGQGRSRESVNQQDLNRQSQARDRSSQNSFNRSNATRPSGGSGARPGGGGGRRR
jgi:hypothetical protein